MHVFRNYSFLCKLNIRFMSSLTFTSIILHGKKLYPIDNLFCIKNDIIHDFCIKDEIE